METKIKTVYNKAAELCQKLNPESEPYKYKYEAKEELVNLREELIGKWSADQKGDVLLSDNEKQMIGGHLGQIYFKIGEIAFETEEPNADTFFNEAVEWFRKSGSVSPEIEFATHYQEIYNSLAAVLSSRGEYEQAQSALQQSTAIYFGYKDSLPNIVTTQIPKSSLEKSLEDQGLTKEEWNGLRSTWKLAESLYTHTLFFLAQVEANLGAPELSAKYCHITLKRQLQTGDYDPSEWAKNCLRIGNYYMTTDDDFVQAEHCIQAGFAVYSTIPKSDQDEAFLAEFDMVLGKFWASILRSAYERGSKSGPKDEPAESAETTPCKSPESNKENEVDATPTPTPSNSTQKELKETLLTTPLPTVDGTSSGRVLFSEIKDLPASQLPLTPVTTYAQARILFLNAVRFLEAAKKYYVLDGFVSDHVDLVQNISRCYRFLAGFETDAGNKAKMHKRRIDALTSIVTELNPQYYLGIIRSLQYEIGETYAEMVDVKYPTNPPSNPTKCNLLISSSITFFKAFISSFKDEKGVMPEKIQDEDLLHPWLNAHFQIGRMSARRYSSSMQDQIQSLDEAQASYMTIQNYCKKNSVTNVFQTELSYVKELTTLIPLRKQVLIQENKF